MTPVIKANYNGLQAPSFKEEGFTPSNFSSNSNKVFNAYKILLDPSYGNDPANLESPNVPDDYNTRLGVRVGTNSSVRVPGSQVVLNPRLGMVCEKPAMLEPRSGEAITFYPLGCNGTGASLSDASQGFDVASYKEGGDIPDSNTSSAVVPIHGISASSIFNPSASGYSNYKIDKECLYNYRGAFPTDAHNPVVNLLKYPQSSTETHTETLTSRIIFQYSIEDIKTVLNVVVSVNGTPVILNVNYTISTAGLILFTDYLNAGTTITITITRHNYWESCWDNKVATSSNPSAFTGNFLSAEDPIDIRPLSRSSDCTFTVPITITEAGYYCFSTWCRLNSDSIGEKTAIAGLHFVTNRAQALIDGRDTSRPSYVISDAFESTTQELTYDTFRVSTHWDRYAKVSYLQPGTYYAAIKWLQSDMTTVSSTSTLRFVGMLVEKTTGPSTYDNRLISYTNLPKQPILSAHALVFALPNFSVSNNWTIVYSRYIFDNAGSGLSHFDSFGDIVYGYFGSQIMVDGSPVTGLSVNSNDFYNRWERVMLEHTANSSTIKMTVTSQGVNEDNPEKSYEVNISMTGHTFETTLYEASFNLMLGSTLNNNTLTFYNCSYKNVWWIPYIMTDKEKHDFLYKVLEVFEDNCETSRTSITSFNPPAEPTTSTVKSTSVNVLLRSVFLEEAED